MQLLGFDSEYTLGQLVELVAAHVREVYDPILDRFRHRCSDLDAPPPVVDPVDAIDVDSLQVNSVAAIDPVATVSQASPIAQISDDTVDPVAVVAPADTVPTPPATVDLAVDSIAQIHSVVAAVASVAQADTTVSPVPTQVAIIAKLAKSTYQFRPTPLAQLAPEDMEPDDTEPVDSVPPVATVVQASPPVAATIVDISQVSTPRTLKRTITTAQTGVIDFEKTKKAKRSSQPMSRRWSSHIRWVKKEIVLLDNMEMSDHSFTLLDMLCPKLDKSDPLWKALHMAVRFTSSTYDLVRSWQEVHQPNTACYIMRDISDDDDSDERKTMIQVMPAIDEEKSACVIYVCNNEFYKFEWNGKTSEFERSHPMIKHIAAHVSFVYDPEAKGADEDGFRKR